jgi:polynucleotide 5'-hydroxyl-kinase GRC3/NOL9
MNTSFLKKPKLKVLILGGVDTGKTYLSFTLIKKALQFRKRVGFLCTDLGQSSLGPPGCVSFKIFTNRDKVSYPLAYISPDRIDFVGSLSPQGCIASFLVSTKLVLEKALKEIPLIIINTTGYIKPPEACLLKFLKIRLIAPDIILAIQEKRELEPILENFYTSKIKIYKLKKSKKARKRTRSQRASFRLALFKSYFREAKLLIFKKNITGVEKNMVVGLLDENLHTICLGLVKDKKRYLEVLAPPCREEVKFIKPSTIFVEGGLNEK